MVSDRDRTRDMKKNPSDPEPNALPKDEKVSRKKKGRRKKRRNSKARTRPRSGTPIPNSPNHLPNAFFEAKPPTKKLLIPKVREKTKSLLLPPIKHSINPHIPNARQPPPVPHIRTRPLTLPPILTLLLLLLRLLLPTIRRPRARHTVAVPVPIPRVMPITLMILRHAPIVMPHPMPAAPVAARRAGSAMRTRRPRSFRRGITLFRHIVDRSESPEPNVIVVARRQRLASL